MDTGLAQSLLITGIGMGLVVACLVLLWGLMALLVRLTRERTPGGTPPAVEQSPVPPMQADDHKKQAAVAAVAVALARARQARRPQHPVGTASPSPWQAAHRRAGERGRRTVE